MSENIDANDKRHQNLVSQYTEKKEQYRKMARNWRVSYRLLLVLSAVLSASAAIVTQIPSFVDKELATELVVLFPAIVTVITTIIASLDFDTNWRINRAARHNMEILLTDLNMPDYDSKKINEGYKRIIKMRLDSYEKSD